MEIGLLLAARLAIARIRSNFVPEGKGGGKGEGVRRDLTRVRRKERSLSASRNKLENMRMPGQRVRSLEEYP